MEEIHEVKDLRNTFQEYVSPQIMQEIISRAEHIVPAERKKVTVLFSDLKGSVPWGEGLRSEPEKLFKELNEVVAEMMDVVLQYDGTVLRFTGDGLIAVYGAPLDQPSPALNAILTGMEMQRKMENLNAQRVADGEQALGMRVGINTGEAVVGSIGSKKRRQYTAGDNVNVAQRTEGECEPGRVTITEGTYQEVKDDVVVESMGMRIVKGKSEPLMFYRVMSTNTTTTVQ
jgi:adenylate cyclase